MTRLLTLVAAGWLTALGFVWSLCAAAGRADDAAGIPRG